MVIVDSRKARRWLCFKLVAWLVCLAVLAVDAAVSRAAEPWEITADRITRFKDPASVVAEGNVVLQRRKTDHDEFTTIKADWMRYDAAAGRVKARGNLSLFTSSSSEQVLADEADLDLNDNTGSMNGGVVIFDHGDYELRISGREIIKTGENTYELHDSRITTCPPREGKVLPWVVESADARVKRGGMAVMKPAILKIREVPVLYTPYLTFPAKTERESGFLFPEFSNSSRDGAGFVVPYFINISPSADATLYPGYFEERGRFAGVEFRYMANAASRGTFALSYLDDRKVDTLLDDFNDDGILRSETNRYWLRGKADHDFGNNLHAKFDLDLVSDQDYLQEFRKGMVGFDASNQQIVEDFNRSYQEETVDQRKSNLQFVKNWPSMSLLGGVAVVQDAKETPSAITPAQALPKIQLNGRHQFGQSSFSATWYAEYLKYYRESGLGYQRADFFPKISWSMPRGYFEGTVSGAVRETMYQVERHGDPALSTWNYDYRPSRTIGYFDASIASPWQRDFDLHVGPVNSLNHILRPQVSYSYVPEVEQDELPRIDGVDRIVAKNQVTYAWNNYFKVAEAVDGGGAKQREFGIFNLKQSYDLLEAKRELTVAGDHSRPYSDVFLETELSPFVGLKFSYDSAWSVYGQGNTYYQVMVSSGQVEQQHRLSASYTYQKDPTVRQPFFYSEVSDKSERKLSAILDTALTDYITLHAVIDQRRQIDNNHIDQTIQLTYKPSCWAATLQWSETDEDQRLSLMFSLTGIGELAGIGFAGGSGMNYDIF